MIETSEWLLMYLGGPVGWLLGIPLILLAFPIAYVESLLLR
jgi:hypothetical protein